MTIPKGILLFYAVGMMVIGVYVLAWIPKLPSEQSPWLFGFGAFCLLVGGALWIRWKYSPLLYLGAFGVALAHALYTICIAGHTGPGLGVLLGSLIALPGYWVTRSEVRRQTRETT